MLARIQNDLFDLGADLTMPDADDAAKRQRKRRCASARRRLSAWRTRSTRMNAELAAAALLRAAGRSRPPPRCTWRARCVGGRSAAWWSLPDQPDEPVSAPALKYINRLSDLLFVASRYVNDRGEGDVLWVPGQNRSRSAASPVDRSEG